MKDEFLATKRNFVKQCINHFRSITFCHVSGNLVIPRFKMFLQTLKNDLVLSPRQ